MRDPTGAFSRTCYSWSSTLASLNTMVPVKAPWSKAVLSRIAGKASSSSEEYGAGCCTLVGLAAGERSTILVLSDGRLLSFGMALRGRKRLSVEWMLAAAAAQHPAPRPRGMAEVDDGAAGGGGGVAAATTAGEEGRRNGATVAAAATAVERASCTRESSTATTGTDTRIQDDSHSPELGYACVRHAEHHGVPPAALVGVGTEPEQPFCEHLPLLAGWNGSAPCARGVVAANGQLFCLVEATAEGKTQGAEGEWQPAANDVAVVEQEGGEVRWAWLQRAEDAGLRDEAWVKCTT